MAFSQDWSGQQISDYRLLRRLGSGSFGEVYLAEDLREHTQVAVKLMKASLTGHEDLKAFLNETRSMRLRHPHILPLLDFGLSKQGQPFLVMEYVAGGTLRDRYPKGSKVSLEIVVGLTTQLASALQYAHDRHLIHRDVKPENMLCRTDGTVLLSDFGIASVAHASSSVDAYQSIGGTLPYMAPEQHLGKPRRASDQYALAVVVYEWLAGARPFQGTLPELVSQHLHAPPPSLRSQVPMLPIAIEQVVFKALSKDPQDRFPHVDDFAVALQVAYPQPVVPPLTTLSQRPASPEAHQPVQDQSTEVPTSPLPLTPAPVHRPIQRRRVPNRRVLFALLLVLLVTFSGGGFYYFGVITLSPAQAIAATATAAAQAYATGTARQGVMFGLDAAHTHNNPYEHTLNPSNVSRLKPLWSFATGSYIYSSPAVADGMVYVGSEDNKLYAFDATCRNACQPLWSFAAGRVIDASPAVTGEMVYVGSNDKFYVFDATCRSACQPLWSFGIEGQTWSSPVITGGMIYVGSSGKLYVFDATCRSACQPLRIFATGGGGGIFSPTVAGGMVYVGSLDNKLYAFDAACRNACQPLWSFATGGSISSSPAVAGGIVYVGSEDHKLYAFDATCRTACHPLWSFATGSFISSSPAVADGMVYVGSLDNKLYAFDAACRNACQPLWSFSTGDVIFSSPTVAGGIVYVGSWDSKLYAFDTTCRDACQPLWSFAAGDRISSSPTVANGMVYVGSDDHKFYAFGLVG